MNPRLNDEYRAVLRGVARELSEHKSVPLDVDRLCTQFNIKISRTNAKSYKNALLVSTKNGVEIRLPAAEVQVENREKYTSMERFLIAHELGHFFLWKKCGLLPRGKSEYWQQERLCNYFARTLLLPDSFVLKELKREKTGTPTQRLGLTIFLAKVARSPWPAVAHKVAELDPKIFFFRIIIRSSPAKETSFFLDMSTLPNRKEQRRKFSAKDSELGRRLALLNEGIPVVNLDRNVFMEKGTIKKFPSFDSASQGTAFFHSPTEIRLAIELSLPLTKKQ